MYKTYKEHGRDIDMTQKYIAILGYATSCTSANKERAFKIGSHIALCGFTVCAGNLTGTFYHAFKGAKSVGGKTLAVLENTKKISDKPYCDEAIFALDTDTKHQMIAEKCIGAIVIGGGEGTKKLITRFLQMNKGVVAISSSGGVVNEELDKRAKVMSDLKIAINALLE